MKCARSVPAYFAEMLYYAMKVGERQVHGEETLECLSSPNKRCLCVLQGAGTDDNTLIRVMVTRSEVDMLDIRAAFRRMFACSLHSMIKVRECTHAHAHIYSIYTHT